MDRNVENKLLLIEDDAFQLEIIGALFQEFRLDLSVASTAEKALHLLEDCWHPIIILNEEFNEFGGGIKLLQQFKLHGLTDNSVIVMMTSEINLTQRLSAIENGVDFFVLKPINHDSVTEILASSKKLSKERMKWFKEECRRQDRENNYREILDILPDIVYQIDLEGRFVYVNNAVHQLGYEPKELIGQHFSVIFDQKDGVENISRQSVIEKIKKGTLPSIPCPKLFDEQRTGSRRTEHLEVCLKHKEGVLCPTKLSSFGDISSQGFVDKNARKGKRVVTGTIGVIHDVTKYKNMESQLKEALDKMNQANVKRLQAEKSHLEDHDQLLKHSTELETFAYRVAHDLKSPLIFLRSMTELYQNNDIDRDLFLTKLSSNLNKSISMVNGLYNLGRLKRKEHIWGNISLEEMVNDVAQWLENDIKSKKIKLIIDCPDEVHGIEDVLPLVFLNLIANAIKYNNAQHPCVRISSQMEASNILVKVEDNGPGMPLNAEKKIFEAFVQLDKSRLSEGLGVGLNTVNKALILHQSPVWVGRSEDLGGACLSFQLQKAKPKYQNF